jgi:hypothetical protein
MSRMYKQCQHPGCRKKVHRKADRFCRPHGLRELDRINRAHPDYFQPLHVWTIDGPQKLSAHKWLVLEEEQQARMGASQ